MILLDGFHTASVIRKKLREETELIRNQGNRVPHLAAILVGDDGASETYVNNKIKACEDTGFRSSLFRYPAAVSQDELIQKIKDLNEDPEIDGFIVQLPLPDHMDVSAVTLAVDPDKDVDGFHPVNMGRMVLQIPGFIPATPKGILSLLKHFNIETSGKHCVVVGRSNIVGTPMSILLSRNTPQGNCTVTLCHSKTPDLKKFTREADILVAAIGKPEFIDAGMVKEGAVVIDVGMSRVPSDKTKSGFRLAGDVDFNSVALKSSYITPVPKGVGPMTIAGLLENTMLAYKRTVAKNAGISA